MVHDDFFYVQQKSLPIVLEAPVGTKERHAWYKKRKPLLIVF
jgi:hypothetical protein